VSQVGDVVFTSKGTVGRFAFVGPDVEQFVYSPQLCYWRSLNPQVIDPRWLYYWMHSSQFLEQARGVAGQTDMADYVSLRDQRRFWISVPNIEAQAKLAELLASLDDKIELNRRMNETLEAMARALFRSWFVDFDPVRAKSEGRPTGLPADLDTLFPNEFEDSPLGEIPKGWKAGTVSDVAGMGRQQVNPGDSTDEVFAHFSIPAFDAGRNPILEVGFAIKSNKLVVTPGSILVSKLNPHIPRVWLTDVDPAYRAVGSTEFFVLQAKAPHSSAFLYSLMSSPEFAVDLQTLVTGTSNSHQRVQPEAFMSYSLVVPSDETATAFESLVKPLLDQVLANRKEMAQLAKTRDELLPRLLSGEIEVAEAEGALHG
jgi:type I restriction enzyme S subunit